ncbi:MAG: hypothetical protein ACOX7P_03200 [Oscillospiraceae bacterium]|jgi:hypothetical protein
MNEEIRQMLKKLSEDPQIARLLAGRDPEKMLSEDPRAAAIIDSLSGSGPEAIRSLAMKMLSGPQGELLKQMFEKGKPKP